MNRICLIRGLVHSFDIGYYFALVYLAALLGVDLHEFASKSCRNLDKFAPRSLNIAERIALLIGLSDVRLYSRSSLSIALELPEELSFDG